MKKNILLTQPSFNNKETKNVVKTINSGWVTQGNQVLKFEKSFFKYHKVNYAIATNSCTTGLHLILSALKLNKDDEIIVPAYTWISTANAVLYTNAKLVLVDVDKNTNNICLTDLKKKINNKTKVIIVVHLFGLCADMIEIKKITSNKITIIEDAACATGSKIKNKFAGSFGLAASFSFHPRKIITTGEGGMITTSNKIFAKKLMQLRNHGANLNYKKNIKPYFMPRFSEIGYNYRMTDIQGAIGVEQMKKLSSFIFFRNKWAKYYSKKLKNIKWIILPTVPSNFTHSWQAYVIHIDKNILKISRNKIMDYLKDNGIQTRPGTHAIHLLEIYKKKFGFKKKDFPGAVFCEENSIALPLHNKMIKNDFDYIINSLKKI